MAEKFPTRTSNKANATSLLLQPAASGFTLNQMAGNALLMPISQQEIQSCVQEPETGLGGQETKKMADPQKELSEPRTCTLFNSSESAPELFSSLTHDRLPTSFQDNSASTTVPLCSDSQPTDYRNVPYMQSQNFYRSDQFLESSNADPQQMPYSLPSSSQGQMYVSSHQWSASPISDSNLQAQQKGSSSNVVPPKGPAQNYRITGRTSYAPPPGIYTSSSFEAIRPPDLSNTSNFNEISSSFSDLQVANTTQAPPVSEIPISHMQVQQYAPTNSAQNMETTNPVQATWQPDMSYNTQPVVNQNSNFMVPPVLNSYRPVTQHWFYCKLIESKSVWFPFSLLDSLSLEEAFLSGQDLVATDGGRYDVILTDLIRRPVYWDEPNPAVVRRCSWFYKGDGERYIPYIESHCQILEDAYKTCLTTNVWHKEVNLGEHTVTIHNEKVMVHSHSVKLLDEWGSVTSVPSRNQPVRRGVDEFDNVEDGEPAQIDHLVFVVHGIGPVCDLRFRDVIDCVDDFRSISLTMVQSHFSNAQSEGKIGRIEFLPVKWHCTLHDDTGLDQNIKPITLNSIPKLRHFANDTVLDVLYYTSPVYCQTIVDTVCSEINRLLKIFLRRNLYFNGEKSVIGHSLGSLILYDLLVNQCNEVFKSTANLTGAEVKNVHSRSETPKSEIPDINDVSDLLDHLNLQEYAGAFHQEQIDWNTLMLCSDNDLKEINIPLGPRRKILSYIERLETTKSDENSKGQTQEKPASSTSQSPNEAHSVTSVNYFVSTHGTGNLNVVYPRFDFHPSCFFALGSPVPMFLTVRGMQSFSEDFRLPTCPRYFNIFHPFDPVAYRMEPLIDRNFNLDPVLIPHHKGRKRLHLELKESLTKVGTDIKHKLVESIRSTWNSVYEFARFHQNDELSKEVDKVVEEEMQKQHELETYTEADNAVNVSNVNKDIKIGNLNEGRRIDYVLQEKPIESINQYLFALTSHACYWESEDTVLFILKELYSLQGIETNGIIQDKPKLQLYNPAAISNLPEVLAQRPTDYMPSPFSHAQPAATPFQQPTQINENSTIIRTFPNQVPRSEIKQPNSENNQLPASGPPPFSGFVRTQIKR